MKVPHPVVARQKHRIADLEARADRTRRSVLEPDILRGMLPYRAQTIAHRAALPAAREREARFRAASTSYVPALQDRRVAETMRQAAIDGLVWWVPLTRPDDLAFVARYLTHQDFPYRVIAQTRESAIGGVMLDIGANTGRMCVPRVVLGDVTAAYCAEPDPLNYSCLVRNVRDNGLAGLVLPDNVAIHSENGVVRLERQKSAGGHRVIEGERRSGREVVEVPAVTLETWIERLGVSPDEVSFVKIDAQGSEVHVLTGAGRLLAARHIAWQIEVDPPLLAQRGFTSGDLFAALQPHFTHFIDLNRRLSGPRIRPITALAEGLAYIVDGRAQGERTDLLLVNAALE